MANFYCVHCGQKYNDLRTLTGNLCLRHPSGQLKGKHVLYEGSEKLSYNCKYYGKQFRTIQEMTGVTCLRHPAGQLKGNHSPAI